MLSHRLDHRDRVHHPSWHFCVCASASYARSAASSHTVETLGMALTSKWWSRLACALGRLVPCLHHFYNAWRSLPADDVDMECIFTTTQFPLRGNEVTLSNLVYPHMIFVGVGWTEWLALKIQVAGTWVTVSTLFALEAASWDVAGVAEVRTQQHH